MVWMWNKQVYLDLRLEHAISGFKPTTKKAKYKEADEQIFALVSNFDDKTNILEFLKGISNNCSFE